MKRIPVKSSAGPYSVVSGAGATRRAAQEIAALGRFSSVHVVSSPKVWRAVGKTVQRGLCLAKGSSIHLFDDAESAKNLRSVEQITRSLCRAGADRQSLVVAVGGGVVGDVAGFAAAVFLRGVKLVHIPTTLVSQVDSSIGGKTGVNLPEGKNLVGSFYPPRVVFTDPELLYTLSDREFRGGLAEVIKHAIIADAEMFAILEKDMDKVLRRDRQALGFLIPRNVEIKARVVSRDEREAGLREILNFGHTFAHALESVSLGHDRRRLPRPRAWLDARGRRFPYRRADSPPGTSAALAGRSGDGFAARHALRQKNAQRSSSLRSLAPHRRSTVV
jgi:3-dehydroquinate synthase